MVVYMCEIARSNLLLDRIGSRGKVCNSASTGLGQQRRTSRKPVARRSEISLRLPALNELVSRHARLRVLAYRRYPPGQLLSISMNEQGQ